MNVFDLNEHEPERLSEIAGEAIVRGWAHHGQVDSSDNNSVENGKSVFQKAAESGPLGPLHILGDTGRYLLPHPSKSPTSLPLYFYMGFQYIEEMDYKIDSLTDKFDKKDDRDKIKKARQESEVI